MKIADGLYLYPHSSGCWAVRNDDVEIRFPNLNLAVEHLGEVALIRSVNDVSRTKGIEPNQVAVRDALEAFRTMMMNWYQLQIPDPHEVEDINLIAPMV